jgi:hypothetical protein
MHELSYETKP